MVKLKDAVVPVGLLEEVAVVKGLVKDGLGDVFGLPEVSEQLIF